MAVKLEIGDHIFGYKIINILRGGMGIVYVVRGAEEERLFVYKTFQDEVFLRSPKIAERFVREAAIWINLEGHPNIVKASGVRNREGKPYISAEYINGGDLSRWIEVSRLTEDLPRMLLLALQFCDGMMHALSKGLKAHRDIKPQNCLITPDMTLKITDFGLAKVFDDDERTLISGESLKASDLSLGLTRTGVAAGTPYYMAPEQFDDAKHVDVRADIYSFGVMLYQMVSGRLPFTGRTWQELERQHRTQTPLALSTPNERLRWLIAKCLAKKADERFEDFGEVRTQLENAYRILMGEAAPERARGVEPSAFEWLGKGVNLMSLGKNREALVCLDRALELDPRQGFAWGIKASILTGLGLIQEALSCYDRELENLPRNYIALNDKGGVLLQLQRVNEALICFDQAVKFNRRHSESWYNKGRALALLKRYEEALACFVEADKLGHSDAKEKAATCRRYMAKSKPMASPINRGRDEEQPDEDVTPEDLQGYESLIANCDNAIRRNPFDAEAWLNKGLALGSIKRSQEALACLERTLQINPRHAGALTYKGLNLFTSHKYDEALTCLERALEINPDMDLAWGWKGEIMLKLARHEAAITCFERALAINPRGAWWTRKADVLVEWEAMKGTKSLEPAREALDCLDRAIAVNPRDVLAWYNKGVMLTFGFQRHREALACFEEARRLGHPQAAQSIVMCRKNLDKQQDSS